LIDIDIAECKQVRRSKKRIRIKQPAVRGDHTNPVAACRVGEASRVGEFSAKVETTREGENFSERQTMAVESFCGRERSFGIQQQTSANTAHLRR
jgi:hypothetical protein